VCGRERGSSGGQHRFEAANARGGPSDFEFPQRTLWRTSTSGGHRRAFGGFKRMLPAERTVSSRRTPDQNYECVRRIQSPTWDRCAALARGVSQRQVPSALRQMMISGTRLCSCTRISCTDHVGEWCKPQKHSPAGQGCSPGWLHRSALRDRHDGRNRRSLGDLTSLSCSRTNRLHDMRFELDSSRPLPKCM